MGRPEYLAAIKNRILLGAKGAAYVASDFYDIAEDPAVRMALTRLEKDATLRRVLRGVYEYPEYSDFLQEYVAPNPDTVAQAIARNYGWTIVPCGNTALNLLGLSTQVPAVWSYVSDGPYKTYAFDAVTLQFKHTNNKEITGISTKSALVVQALKTLGRENLGDAIAKLRRALSAEEKLCLLSETQHVTAWIYAAIKRICRENHSNESSCKGAS